MGAKVILFLKGLCLNLLLVYSCRRAQPTPSHRKWALTRSKKKLKIATGSDKMGISDVGGDVSENRKTSSARYLVHLQFPAPHPYR